jgi:hypothetical protein
MHSDATYIAASMLGGAATAMVNATYHRRNVLKAAVGGAAGGLVTHGGLRIVGQGREELWLVGLQTTAIGGSIVRNAGNGTALLEHLTFVTPPLIIDVRLRNGPPVRARVAAGSLAMLVATPLRFPNARFDARTSLLTLSPVWQAEWPLRCKVTLVLHDGPFCWVSAGGQSLAGVTAWSQSEHSPILAHELMHVAQYIRGTVAHAVPAWDAAVGNRGIGRYLVVEAFQPTFAAMLVEVYTTGTWESNWIEYEADDLLGLNRCKLRRLNC